MSSRYGKVQFMTISIDVLAGLDDVDWAALDHAYGPATDVPVDLRAICGDDIAAMSEAFDRLANNVGHQGSRYPATPFVVPFLARIAVAGTPWARVNALPLLTFLAVAWHDEYKLPMGIDPAGWRASVTPPDVELREIDEEIAGETNPGKRDWLLSVRALVLAGRSLDGRIESLHAYDAVRRELPLVLGLLADPDFVVRQHAAYLVSWFPEEAASIVPTLVTRLDCEFFPETLATVVLGIGLLGSAEQIEPISVLLDSPEPLVRWAAATALARLRVVHRMDGALAARAFGELARVASGPRLEQSTDHNDGNLYAYTGRSLLLFIDSAPEHRLPVDEVLMAVAGCLQHVTIRQCDTVAGATLEKAFDVQGTGPAPAFGDLSPGRRTFLRALANHPGALNYHQFPGLSLERLLPAARLPEMSHGLRTYTGLPPANKIDDLRLPDDWWAW
ncbi:HEAT repeat domain-containing protein [Kribbella qitaiheensis]|nr:HEAT repeat domain-containing protein [Kribbella qitaiheensis]